jgi:IS605 OrfB family transposase
MVRIVPVLDGRSFKMEFVYELPRPNEVQRDGCMSIDLGLTNYATYFTSDGSTGIIDGSYVKSVNQWYNKENARLKAAMTHGKKSEKGVRRPLSELQVALLHKRDARIGEFMNRSVNQIVKLCLEKNIGTVVIGELKDIKREIDHGRRGNQNFVQIPNNKF